MNKIFNESIKDFSKNYFSYLTSIFDKIDLSEIEEFINILLDARERGATVYFIGNGGSASTASHFANDLAFGVREYNKPFKVVSMVDNTSVMTALGNDNGYDEIFSRQLQIYGKSGDVLVAISASGNSKNLIKAFECALPIGIKTVALTAFDGGRLRKMADHCVHVPTNKGEYGPAEDLHLILDHLVGNYLFRLMKKKQK